MRAAVLTVSDGVSEGTREDKSGDVLEELLAGEGYEVERRVVPDERDAIADAISELAEAAQVVLTTGGTGLGPRDVTPEATMNVLDRAAPGIAEAIRADSITKTPHALLSRGIAGVAGRRWSSTCPVHPAAAATALRSCGRPGPRARAPRRRGRGAPPDMSTIELPRRFASLVKIEHTVFALPFAYVGAFLASTACRARTTCSGSRSRWSVRVRWRWPSTG